MSFSRGSASRIFRRVLNPLRWIVTGGLLAYLIIAAGPIQIWDALVNADRRLLILAVFLQFIGVALSAAKWGILLRARGHRVPYLWLLNSYLVGQFANTFLPTVIGGDAVRTVQLRRRIGSLSQASASIFVERLTGFLALSVIANLALIISYLHVTGTSLVTSQTWLIIAIGFSLLAIAAAIASFFAPLILKFFGPYLPRLLLRPMERVANALSDYFPQGGRLLLVVLMSLLFQSLWVVIHLICGFAIGIVAPLLLYALMVPMSDIVGLAPVFLGGVGARELVFTAYLTQLDIAAAQAIALAFLIFAIKFIVSLFGGVVVFFGGVDLKLDVAEAEKQATRTATSSDPISSEL